MPNAPPRPRRVASRPQRDYQSPRSTRRASIGMEYRSTHTPRSLGLVGASLIVGLGCRRSAPPVEKDAQAAAAPVASATAVDNAGPPARADGPKLAAIDMQVNVFARPDPTSPRAGYLRLGAVVDRDPQPSGNDR